MKYTSLIITLLVLAACGYFLRGFLRTLAGVLFVAAIILWFSGHWGRWMPF